MHGEEEGSVNEERERGGMEREWYNRGSKGRVGEGEGERGEYGEGWRRRGRTGGVRGEMEGKKESRGSQEWDGKGDIACTLGWD